MTRPRVITTRTQIRGVAERWQRQYQTTPGDPSRWRAIYEGLCALDGETATPDDVHRVIGNGSWTHIECDQCKREVGAVIEVGEPSDYESRTAALCGECLALAFAAFTSEAT